jgi:hypothetical protein
MSSTKFVRFAISCGHQLLLLVMFATVIVVAIGVPKLRAAIEESGHATGVEQRLLDFLGL